MNILRHSFGSLEAAYHPVSRADDARASFEAGEIKMLTPDMLGLASHSSLRSVIERSAGEDGDRSAHVLRCAGAMVRAGFGVEAILGVILNPENGVSEHVFAQKDPEWAARRAVEKALAGGAGRQSERGAGSSGGEGAHAAPGPQEADETQPLALIDAADFEGKPKPTRSWLWHNHFLPGAVTGVYGEGSVGKSLLVQQACTALSAGVSLFGLAVAQCNSAYLTAEDDLDELIIRQADICASLGVKHRDLRGKLFLGSLIDETDKALMRTSGRYGDRLLPTKMLRRLRETIVSLGLRCVALDNISHFFGGNEIARDDVVAFLGELNAMARSLDCAIILIGHPNKTGAAYSGSTAWQNQVRMQLVLTKPDRDGDPNMRELRREKANYGPPGDPILMLWHHGAFVPEADVPGDDADRVHAAMMRQSEIFFACLDELTRQERNLSMSKNAGNYAPKLMVTLPGSLKKGMDAEDFEKVMSHLLTAGMIETGDLPWRSPSRNAVIGLRRKPGATGGDDEPM